MLNERKVAQMATFFLRQTSDKRLPHLKLMKLLYLADRCAVKNFGRPMSGDRFVSMRHGPALSQTLDLMDGDTEAQPGGWEDWISDKENHEVALRHPNRSDNLDELAQAEIDVLRHVWSEFGAMMKWEIRDWTHRNCAEWSPPGYSPSSISYEDMAHAVGFGEAEAKALAEQHQAEQDVKRIFASL